MTTDAAEIEHPSRFAHTAPGRPAVIVAGNVPMTPTAKVDKAALQLMLGHTREETLR